MQTEQLAALQSLGDISSPDNLRRIEIMDRIDAKGKAPGIDPVAWSVADIKLSTELDRRYRADGLKKSVDWYEIEGRKSADEILRDWGPTAVSARSSDGR